MDFNLYYYVQAAGIGAIVTALAALALLAGWCRARTRSVAWFRALLLAAVSLVLASICWQDVSMIRPDLRDEMVEGRERQKEARLREEEQQQQDQQEKGAEASRTTADDGAAAAEEEDDDDDEEEEEPNNVAGSVMDRTHRLSAGLDALSAAYGAKVGEDAEPEPEYRKKGKQQREAGKKITDEVLSSVEDKVTEALPGRVMKEEDMYRAVELGRLLLSGTTFLLLLALAAVLWDYLARFNCTFDCFLPLPLGLFLVDRFLPKRLSVCVCRRHSAAATAAYLRDIVRRGDNFIYFGPEDPLPETRLARLRVGETDCLPLEKTVCRAGRPWLGPEFVFETAWFGRNCFVIEGRELAVEVAKDVCALLQMRYHTRARCVHTLHLVWDDDRFEDAETLSEWIRCGQTANVKTVLLGAAEAGELCDEVYETWPSPRPYPLFPGFLLHGPPARWMVAGLSRVARLVRAAAAWLRRRLPADLSSALRKAPSVFSRLPFLLAWLALVAIKGVRGLVPTTIRIARWTAAGARTVWLRGIRPLPRWLRSFVLERVMPGARCVVRGALLTAAAIRKHVRAAGTRAAQAAETRKQRAAQAAETRRQRAAALAEEQRRAEEEAKRRAEEEAAAKRRAEEAARREAQEQERRRAEEEARRQAELERRRAEAEARRQAEAEIAQRTREVASKAAGTGEAPAAPGVAGAEAAGELKFECPHCQQRIIAESDMQGQRLSCPRCRKPMMVPVLTRQPAREDFVFACPKCRQRLAVSGELAGKSFSCPRCRETIDVPSDAPGSREH